MFKSMDVCSIRIIPARAGSTQAMLRDILRT